VKFVVGERSSQTQLQLGLGRTKEGLVDVRVGRIEGDVGTSAVGEALEDDLLTVGDLEELT